MRRSFSERIKKLESELVPLLSWDKIKAGIFDVTYRDGREEVIRIDWPYGGRISVCEDGRVMVFEDLLAEEGEEVWEMPFLLAPGCSSWDKFAGVIKGL